MIVSRFPGHLNGRVARRVQNINFQIGDTRNPLRSDACAKPARNHVFQGSNARHARAFHSKAYHHQLHRVAVGAGFRNIIDSSGKRNFRHAPYLHAAKAHRCPDIQPDNRFTHISFKVIRFGAKLPCRQVNNKTNRQRNGGKRQHTDAEKKRIWRFCHVRQPLGGRRRARWDACRYRASHAACLSQSCLALPCPA